VAQVCGFGSLAGHQCAIRLKIDAQRDVGRWRYLLRPVLRVVSRQRYLLFGTLIMTNIVYARMAAGFARTCSITR
jgi:hypothetical protein